MPLACATGDVPLTMSHWPCATGHIYHWHVPYVPLACATGHVPLDTRVAQGRMSELEDEVIMICSIHAPGLLFIAAIIIDIYQF